MDYGSLLSLIKKRRSIRRYEPEPVPMEDVMKVLDAARWAPSGDNSQPWEFVVIRDPEKLNQVMDILIESAGTGNNRMFILHLLQSCLQYGCNLPGK